LLVEVLLLKVDQIHTIVRKQITYISQSVGLPPADILPIQKVVRRTLIRPAKKPMSALIGNIV
jgi:hypothetical protein